MTAIPHTHAAQLEAMRELAAPVGSRWRHRKTGVIWHLRERDGASVVLQLPVERVARRGPLATLLKNYVKEPK